MIVIFETIGLTLSKLVSKSGKTVETKENKECGRRDQRQVYLVQSKSEPIWDKPLDPQESRSH